MISCIILEDGIGFSRRVCPFEGEVFDVRDIDNSSKLLFTYLDTFNIFILNFEQHVSTVYHCISGFKQNHLNIMNNLGIVKEMITEAIV